MSASARVARLLWGRICTPVMAEQSVATPGQFAGRWGLSCRLMSGEAAASAPKPPPPPPPPQESSNTIRYLLLGGLGVGGAFAWTLFNSKLPQAPSLPTTSPSAPVKDYEAVRKAIASKLDVDSYDDGSYGPLLVRLAWHASGTYDAATNTGGSNGATMRFPPESEFGANRGLLIARQLLEPIRAQFPWITYADLWTLAGVVAIEYMGGPVVPWRPGRTDAPTGAACPPDGRLPDASQGAAHIRAIFGRMGFNDQEMVALSGGHCLGRCHTDRSGYDGPWNNAPTTFSNLYFTELLDSTWVKRKWDGPMQYQKKDSPTHIMMLPTDMALRKDRAFRKWSKLYAEDQEAFFKDFAAAFGRLLELGVPFPEGAKAA